MLTGDQLTDLATLHLAGKNDGETLDLLTLLRAVVAAERERIAKAWDGVECDVHCNGLVDVGASIRAGRLVDRDDA